MARTTVTRTAAAADPVVEEEAAVVTEEEEDMAAEAVVEAALGSEEAAVAEAGADLQVPEAAGEEEEVTGAPEDLTTGGEKSECGQGVLDYYFRFIIVITTCSLDRSPRGQVTMNNVPYL